MILLLRKIGSGRVVSLDNMNDYYEPELKEYRLGLIEEAAKNSLVEHVFVKGSLSDKALVDEWFAKYQFDVVVNLAAQAGVRYSIDHPVSLYAAIKKSNELLAHAYSKLYNVPSTGVRFFTVYGPAGRPDMFYFSATKKLVAGESIRIFNYGNMKRDFTYIDDIVEGIYRVMQGAPEKTTGEDGLPNPPYAVYNIGGGTPENLLTYISVLQEELVRAGVLPADYDFAGHRELVGMQPGDVPVTYADSAALEADYGFTPSIDIWTGLRKFCKWYKEYYL